MSKNIIDVDHVSIRFNLANQKVNNLKEYAIKFAKHELMFQEFLALKDVNLHIKPGESWALIGTNGSGKSTLLKAITGILKPYEGSVKVRGKIAPMIELGAGFDMELTARENIYLNGAVLGYSREFMAQQFDSIVEFAGIGDFLDSPIKNFSSGMKARLGFAVATMVDPDVLICDEVLSVGDVNFRKKCSYRMEQMLNGGTTLLYVSHNMDSVMELCDHAMWLDHGEVVMAGDAETVCTAYNETQNQMFRQERKKQTAVSAHADDNHYDYLVVGAGPFGASFAYQAAVMGKTCLVIDKSDHIGGLTYTRIENNINVSKYGAHICHTNDRETWRFLQKFADFNSFRYAPIASDGKDMFNLALNMNTYRELWHIKTPQEAEEIIRRQTEAEKQRIPEGTQVLNLEQAILTTFGRDIYTRILKGYFEKKWGRPCAELPTELLSWFPSRYSYDGYFYDDQYQGIPASGYTALFENMLEGIEVRLNTDYRSFMKDCPYSFDKVIYTGPVDEYFDYCYGHLAARTVRLEEEVLEIENYQGNAVMFCTGEDTACSSILEHKHLERGTQKNTVISRVYDGEFTPGCGLYPAAPVRDAQSMKRYEQYRQLAEKEQGIVFCGMNGSYSPLNTTNSVAKGRALAKALAARN